MAKIPTTVVTGFLGSGKTESYLVWGAYGYGAGSEGKAAPESLDACLRAAQRLGHLSGALT